MTIQRLLHNWPEKLISLIIATGVWIYATLGVNSVIAFPGKIDIEFRNTNENLAAVSDQTDISIKIKSDSVNLKRITSDNFKAYVDLVGLTAGVYEKEVTVESKNDQIQVVEKNPKKITIRIEPVATKQVPVKTDFSSKAADGYTAIDKSITPSTVEAKGPQSEINKLSVAVATVRLAGETEDFERMSGLTGETTSGEVLKNIQFNPSSVNVGVAISSSTTTKTVGIKAITTGELPTGYQIKEIRYEPSLITITGSSEKIGSLRYLETKPIDISSLKETATLSGNLNIPSGVAIEEKISQIKATFVISPADAYNKFSVKLKTTNLAQGQTASIAQDKVEITLRGPANILNSINPDSLEATLNLDGIKNSMVPVQVSAPDNLPADVEFIGSTPRTVDVTVKNQ